MFELICVCIQAAICYFYAKEIHEQYYDINLASPIMYALGGALFGIIPLLYAMWKVYRYRKRRYGR